MRRFCCFLFVLGIILSCEIAPLTPNVTPLSVLGILKVGSVAEVSLKKIFSLNEPIDSTKLDILDATLFLEENGNFFDSLKLGPNNIYFSTKKIKANSVYTLKGRLPDGHLFYSANVRTPPIPKPLAYRLFRDAGDPSSSNNDDYVKVEVDWSSLEGNNLFFRFEPFPKFPFISDVYDESNLSIFGFQPDPDCLISTLPSHTRSFLNRYLRRSCVPNGQTSFWLNKTNYGRVTGVTEPMEKVVLTKFTLSYGLVSEEVFFFRNISSPIGIDRIFQEPSRNYTNLTGAQGVVFGQSENHILLQ